MIVHNSDYNIHVRVIIFDWSRSNVRYELLHCNILLDIRTVIKLAQLKLQQSVVPILHNINPIILITVIFLSHEKNQKFVTSYEIQLQASRFLFAINRSVVSLKYSSADWYWQLHRILSTRVKGRTIGFKLIGGTEIMSYEGGEESNILFDAHLVTYIQEE